RGAVDAIAAGLRAYVVDGVAGARRDALHDLGRVRDAETEDIHERVARVRGVERDLAADCRDADAVAIARDAGDDSLEQPPRAWRVELAEPQRVEERNRPRSHRENVADDAAHARRRTLVRLDERRMV